MPGSPDFFAVRRHGEAHSLAGELTPSRCVSGIGTRVSTNMTRKAQAVGGLHQREWDVGVKRWTPARRPDLEFCWILSLISGATFRKIFNIMVSWFCHL